MIVQSYGTRARLIRTTALAATLLTPIAAWAQQAEGGEEIIVTGLRSVDTTAGQVKRAKRGIVDTLTGSEADKLPDSSIAEALDRIVGVSSDQGYNSSQPRTVTVRGFDARYNSMDVDGNPVWNSSRNNRGTQLDVFPSSIINQLNVYKTVLPDQDANSIGGHIELRTLRAFDGGDGAWGKVKGSIGGYEQESVPTGAGGPSYRFSAVGKDTFGSDHRFGIVLGADVQRDRFYDQYDQVTAYSQVAGVDVPNGTLLLGNYDKEITRRSVYGKLEAHATDTLYAFLSANWFRENDTENYYRGGTYFTAATTSGTTADGTGNFTKGTALTYPESYRLDRKTLMLSGGLDYRVGARGALTVRGAFTNYHHDEVLSRGSQFQYSYVTGSYDIGEDYPSVTLAADSKLGVAANWLHQTGKTAFVQGMPIRDKVYSGRVQYDFNTQPDARGFGYQIGGGFRRLDRNYDQTVTSYTLAKGTSFALSQVPLAWAGIQTLDGASPVYIDSAAYWAWMQAHATITTDATPTSDYHLIEDVYAGHAALTFNAGRLHVLVGGRVEVTDFTDVTGRLVSGKAQSVTFANHYTNFLPNAQGSYDIAKGLRVRLAYTRTLARPDFSDFAMGSTITYDTNGYPVKSGTNPYLAPRVADNYDTSIEWYHPYGYVSLGLFHKDLAHETFTQLTQKLNDAGVVIETDTIPLNGGSAKVNGAEASAVIDRFRFLPTPLNGFGVSANYAYLDGSWNVVFSDGSRRTVGGLRNQPKWLANLNLNYTFGRVEVTLAYRLRGRTFTGTFGPTAAGDIWIEDYARLDLQANVRQGRNVSLFGEARNLNNAWWRATTGVDRSLYYATNPGRSYLGGIKLKY